MSARGLPVRSLTGGGDEESAREEGRTRQCVAESSIRGRGGCVKVKRINHSLGRLITSVLTQAAGGI